MTILGTRPEIIRLSLIIKKLDSVCQHILVHTGQNYDPKLNELFFKDLDLRRPDYQFDMKSTKPGEQIGIILKNVEELLIKIKPDKVLILGDTNSALSAIIAERMMIPVYHMEAGNRCYDLKVPEEKNRKIVDSISSVAMPYTYKSRENLIREGIKPHNIYVTGNPIFEVLNHYSKKIEESDILTRLNLKQNEYFLVTAHRSENVDKKERLEQIILGLNMIAEKYKQPIIVSTHPRTKNKLEQFNIPYNTNLIHFMEPFGFFDFVKLEKNARLVLTDSGTVQEECCIYKIPAVTIRDTTERPETVECGSNIISSINSERIFECTNLMINSKRNWIPPAEYLDENVSDKVINIIFNSEFLL